MSFADSATPSVTSTITRWRVACSCSAATATEYRDGIELLPVADAVVDPTSMLTAPDEAP